MTVKVAKKKSAAASIPALLNRIKSLENSIDSIRIRVRESDYEYSRMWESISEYKADIGVMTKNMYNELQVGLYRMKLAYEKIESMERSIKELKERDKPYTM